MEVFSQQKAPSISTADGVHRLGARMAPIFSAGRGNLAYSAIGDQMRFTLIHRTPVRRSSRVPHLSPSKTRPALPEAAAAEVRAPAARAPVASARAGGPNGRGRGARPAAPARPVRRTAATPAKTHRKTAAPARGGGRHPQPAHCGEEVRVARAEAQVARPCPSSASFVTNGGTRQRT